MIRDDWPEFKGVVGAVYGFYRKDRDLTPVTMRMWFEALRAFELATVRAAFTAHMRNPDIGQFLPMPADLVKLIEGGSNDAALIAWARVDRAVRTVGPYRSVVFDDPLIHYAIDNLGGWIHLGGLAEEAWPFARNQFVALYRGARMRNPQHPSRLIGIAEASNSARNAPCALPVLLGDHARCREVLARGFHQPVLEARPAHELLSLKKEAAA
jgi:hypothetical protein